MKVRNAIEILEDFEANAPNADVCVVIDDKCHVVSKIGVNVCDCCNEQIIGVFFVEEEVIH